MTEQLTSPETINWMEYDKDRGNDESQAVAAIIIGAVSDAGGLERFDHFDRSNLQVELKINGVQVPFVETVQRVFGLSRDYINRRAREMIDQTLVGDTARAIDLELEKVEDAMEDLAQRAKRELVCEANNQEETKDVNYIFQSGEEGTFIYFSRKGGFPFCQYNTAENTAVSIYPSGSTGWKAISLEHIREGLTEVSRLYVDGALVEEARRGPMYFASDEEPEIAVVILRGDVDAEVVYNDGSRAKHQWFLWNFILSEKWAALPCSHAASLIEEAENSNTEEKQDVQ